MFMTTILVSGFVVISLISASMMRPVATNDPFYI